MRRGAVLFALGLLVTVAVAAGVAQYASDRPDGLEYVAEHEGFADSAGDHALDDSPLADYGADLGEDDGFGLGVAGVVGTLVTLGAGFGLFWLVRDKHSRDGDARDPAATG